MNNIKENKDKNNFDFETYQNLLTFPSTQTTKIENLYNIINRQQIYIGKRDGKVAKVELHRNFKKIKETIINESVLETGNEENFLFQYNETIDSLLANCFTEQDDPRLQNRISRKDLIKNILSFESLKTNWDGYGAYPLEVESAANAIELINYMEEAVYSKINELYPNPNGTITLTWSNKLNEEVSIEIGNNTMAYYVQFFSKETLYKNNILINEIETAKISDFIIELD